MEKFKALYHQNLSSIKASEGLTSILNQQRNPKLKSGLGYEEGSSSDHPSNTEPIKFVKSSNIALIHSLSISSESVNFFRVCQFLLSLSIYFESVNFLQSTD
jgi:hypothetical protein